MISSGVNIQNRPTVILWLSGEKERFVADTVTVTLGSPVAANDYLIVEQSVDGGETSVVQNSPTTAFEDANVYQFGNDTTWTHQGSPTAANDYMIVDQSVNDTNTVTLGNPVAANEDMFVRTTVDAAADALGSVLQGDPVADHVDA